MVLKAAKTSIQTSRIGLISKVSVSHGSPSLDSILTLIMKPASIAIQKLPELTLRAAFLQFRSKRRYLTRTKQTGFTLIEVMAVVVILSILSSVALLNMNFDNKGRQVREQAQQLAALIQLASDEAIYLQKELGLRFGEGEFVFYQLEKKKSQKVDNNESSDSKQPKPPYWLPVNQDPRLRSRPIPEQMELELSISGVEVLVENPTATDVEELKVKPQIMMLSNGEVLPDFSILIRDIDGEHEYTVASGVYVPVIVERVE